MEKNTEHNKRLSGFEKQASGFFEKAEIPFDKTKDEVWKIMSEKLENKGTGKTVRLSTEKFMLTIAASLIILLSIGSFLRFYNKTVKVGAGEQLTYKLPDGSRIELNAQSVLRYNPLWWSVSRRLSFVGEAFFEVQKGSAFKVESEKGTTEVLGTSFNIYSRADAYKVICVSGKVKVSNKTEEEVILAPDYEASISEDGKITVFRNMNTEQTISWKDGMFNFTATPLQEVIHEIERQYNVSIFTSNLSGFTYTGFFSRNYAVEDVLKMVCKPFNLKYVKKKERVFEVSN